MPKQLKIKVMRNFFTVDTTSDETAAEMRIITGRFTKKRYNIVRNYIRKLNREFSAPYGRSPQGYAYRCGCQHDCCGCSRKSITVDFKQSSAIITLFQTFNY